MRRKALPYCVGRCWIQLLRCPSQLIFIAYPYCTLIAYLYWIEGRCRPVIQISLAYLCWIEGPCRPVIQIFIAYLYCIIIAYLRRGGLIGQGRFFTAYLLHTVASLPLSASILLSVLHICIAYLYCISLLHSCIASLYCIILVAYL